LGEALDLAELIFRATDDAQCHERQRRALWDYQEALDNLATKEWARRDRRPLWYSPAQVNELRAIMLAARKHRQDVNKFPYQQIPFRTLADAACAVRVSESNYQIASSRMRPDRKRQHLEVFDGYAETGETVLIDGQRVPVIKELKATK
jgi:hypothetical protein